MPAERTPRDILNRRNYRLKRIQKGKPLKKTDAIFANVKQVQEQVRNDPKALEISMDTKAKVALGEYVRGEKTGHVAARHSEAIRDASQEITKSYNA